MRRIALFLTLVLAISLTSLPAVGQHASHAAAMARGDGLRVLITGAVEINGKQFDVSSRGKLDPDSGAYSLDFASPEIFSSDSICRLEGALATWIPRVALKFLVDPKDAKQGSLSHSGVGTLEIELTGAPKRDLVSGLNRLAGSIRIQPIVKGVARVQVSGSINTTSSLCWPLEATEGMHGHSVLRLGIKPTISSEGAFAGGSFVGIGRVDFEVPDGDPEGLGHSDFWNLDGTFLVSKRPTKTVAPIASVDVSHFEKDATVVGSISNFPGSTVPFRAVLTIGGTATADGYIHQHLGMSNGRGGGPALTHFDVPIKVGDTPSQVAARVAEGINRSAGGFTGGGHVLAVQGGTGVGVSSADSASPRIAFCVTRDGQGCVGAADPVAMAMFRQSMTQLFGDAGFRSFLNSGLTETFGALGEPPLVGWLTPFKVVFFTDNPETSVRAGGGELRVQSNTCTSSNGGDCDKGTIRTSPAVTIKTVAGETADEVARDVAKALTKVGTKCIQRVGTIVYMDAGLDMPSTLTVWSGDRGLGLMSAAADLPTLADPHPNVIPGTDKEHKGDGSSHH
jgi:hypothetical protein